MLCGLKTCPILEKMRIQLPMQEKVGTSVFGPSPPSVFVGRFGYPDVSWGPTVGLEGGPIDDPSQWYGLGFNEIIKYRSSLVRGKKKQNVREGSRLLEKAQEVVLSVKPVDVEVNFANRPVFRMSFSPVTQPMGPSAMLNDFRVCENPAIPKKIDEVVNEKLKAVEAISELTSHGFDVYYLSKLLSSGVLGKNRRMVPTRWSITALDDMVAKERMKRVREHPQISEFAVFSNEYLYNHFEILLMPGAWEFEQFEAWAPGTVWSGGAKTTHISEEYEGYWGRSDYAESEGGGYYAGRIGVVEALDRMRRQARAVVFREIYEGYMLPVGVWEVRENVRHAFMNRERKFATLEEALVDISARLRIPMKEYVKKSRILAQRRISEF